jgi:regulator of protease activity HflC (stomatin/prohibitin superfamily)
VLDLFRFWVVVDPDEEGLILRMGRFHRKLDSGDWYLKRPFNIDRERKIKVTPDTLNLSAQGLTTRDGVQITVAVIVKFRINDSVKALLEVQDRENVVRDCALAETCWLVQRYDWSAVRSAPFHRKLTRAARRHGEPSGVDIISVKFTDCTTTFNHTQMQVG